MYKIESKNGLQTLYFNGKAIMKFNNDEEMIKTLSNPDTKTIINSLCNF